MRRSQLLLPTAPLLQLLVLPLRLTQLVPRLFAAGGVNSASSELRLTRLAPRQLHLPLEHAHLVRVPKRRNDAG